MQQQQKRKPESQFSLPLAIMHQTSDNDPTPLKIPTLNSYRSQEALVMPSSFNEIMSQ